MGKSVYLPQSHYTTQLKQSFSEAMHGFLPAALTEDKALCMN